MAILTMLSEIKMGDKKLKVETVVQTLIYYPAEKVVRFFESIGLTAPRKLRMSALRKELDGYVTSRQIVQQTLSDEVNYRLSWYDNFSESQLVNLLPQFKSEELEKKARESLWLDLLSYMIEKRVPDKELVSFVNETKNHFANIGPILEDSQTYHDKLNSIFFDEPNEIDGLTPEIFRPVLYKSSTLVELREIGLKFGVDVPRRLKKNELVDIIIRELKSQDIYTKELEDKVKRLAVIQLQRFAIEHNIKASIELKKEEIIEYILSNAKETKAQYYVPTNPGVYEEIKPTERFFVEDVQAEPIIEEEVEALQPEPMVDETVVEAFKPEVEPKAEVKPEPKPEPKSEPQPQPQPQPQPVYYQYQQPQMVKEKETVVVESISKEALQGLVDEIKALRMDLNQYHQLMLDKAYEKAQRPIIKPTFINGFETTLDKKQWDQVEKQETKTIEETDQVPVELSASQPEKVELNDEQSKGKAKKVKKQKSKARRILFWTIFTVITLAIVYALIGFLRIYGIISLGEYGNGDILDRILAPGFEFANMVKSFIDENYLFNFDAFMNWFNNIF